MSLPPPTDPSCGTALTDLALCFRDPATRQSYAARNPEFIPWLADVVRHVQEGNGDPVPVYKLVANFVADDDVNRRLITSSTPFLALLTAHLASPPPSKEILKPLLASVLNILLSTDYLVPHAELLDSWVAFVRIGNGLHLPADPSPSSSTTTTEEEEQVQERATLASWAWTCALRILESATASSPPTTQIPFTTDAIPHLMRPFLHFCGDGRSSATMHEDLTILASCADVVGLLVDDEGWSAGLAGVAEMGQGFVRFIEAGEVVDGWEEDSDSEDEESEDEEKQTPKQTNKRPGEKELGKIKANLMASLASLCATPSMHLFPPTAATPLARTLLRWLDDHSRDDLVACGLLCIGNYITDGTSSFLSLRHLGSTLTHPKDSRAEEITVQPALIAHLTRLLDSSDPATAAQRTHALFGLLRNLVLAPSAATLKPGLAPRVVACVSRVGCFQSGGDLVGSLQGLGVGLMRLLCRNDGSSALLFPRLEGSADALHCAVESARLIFEDEDVWTQVMDLWDRTDEQSIKIEIGRFVACLCATLARASQPTDGQSMLEKLAGDRRTVRALFALVRLGSSQEVLLAEGVLSLALIAKTAQGARAALDILVADPALLESLETYAASPTAPAPILSNICVMLLHLANGRKDEVGSDDDDKVAGTVRRMLDVVSVREDVDEMVKGAVNTALAAWS